LASLHDSVMTTTALTVVSPDSPYKPTSNHRSGYVDFVVDKVAVGQAFIQVLWFLKQYNYANVAYSSIYHRYNIILATVSIM